MTFRQKVIGDCCDGLTGSPDIYIVTQGGIQSRKNTHLHKGRGAISTPFFWFYKNGLYHPEELGTFEAFTHLVEIREKYSTSSKNGFDKKYLFSMFNL